MSVLTAAQELVQDFAESNLYYCDFTNCLGATEKITSITSVTADGSDLTITSSAIVTPANKQITFRVSAGTPGLTHTIKAIVVTDGGNTKVLKMKLTIE